MKYRAFLSVIIILGLVGTILVLVQQKQGLQKQVDDLVQDQANLPPPVNETTPTELVVIDTDSFYPRERVTRESYRCEYENCLFKGGGGLVGVTTLDGFYTTWQTTDTDANPVACTAFYVKRGPASLVEESKYQRFYDEESGILIIPITKESASHAGDWESFLQSTPENPIRLNVFLRDSLEMGSASCDGGLRILEANTI